MKEQIKVLENKLARMTKDNLQLVRKVTEVEEKQFGIKNDQNRQD